MSADRHERITEVRELLRPELREAVPEEEVGEVLDRLTPWGPLSARRAALILRVRYGTPRVPPAAT